MRWWKRRDDLPELTDEESEAIVARAEAFVAAKRRPTVHPPLIPPPSHWIVGEEGPEPRRYWGTASIDWVIERGRGLDTGCVVTGPIPTTIVDYDRDPPGTLYEGPHGIVYEEK